MREAAPAPLLLVRMKKRRETKGVARSMPSESQGRRRGTLYSGRSLRRKNCEKRGRLASRRKGRLSSDENGGKEHRRLFASSTIMRKEE